MRRHWLIGLGLLLLLALVVSACAPAAPAPTATPAPAKKEAAAPAPTPEAKPTPPPKAAQPWEKELKIATINATTGPVAAWEAVNKNGQNLAVEEINKAGGVAGRTLVLGYLDPGPDPTQAASLARQASDWTLVIIGPGTTFNARGAIPVANQLGVPIIAGSTLIELPKQNRPWSFSALSEPSENTRKGVKAFAKREAGVKKVVLITDYEDPASAVQAKAAEVGIKEANLQLLDTIAFKTGDVDFTAQATKAKGLKPDAIIISATPNELGGVIREVRRQGITALIHSTQTGWNPPVITKIAGQALEGVYTAIEWCRCEPGSQKFVKAYEEKFKEKAGQGSIMYYDMVYRVKAAFEDQKLTGDPAKLKEEREKMRQALADPKGWTGAYGKWVWNQDGMPQRLGVLVRVKDGEEVQLERLPE